MSKKLKAVAAQLEVYAESISNAGDEMFALSVIAEMIKYAQKVRKDLYGVKPQPKVELSKDDMKEGAAFWKWFNDNCSYKIPEQKKPQTVIIWHNLKRKGYSKDKVKEAVLFASNDEFWKQNFRSPGKLLKTDKQGVLYIDIFLTQKEMKAPKKSNTTYNPHVSV